MEVVAILEGAILGLNKVGAKHGEGEKGGELGGYGNDGLEGAEGEGENRGSDGDGQLLGF